MKYPHGKAAAAHQFSVSHPTSANIPSATKVCSRRSTLTAPALRVRSLYQSALSFAALHQPDTAPGFAVRCAPQFGIAFDHLEGQQPLHCGGKVGPLHTLGLRHRSEHFWRVVATRHMRHVAALFRAKRKAPQERIIPGLSLGSVGQFARRSGRQIILQHKGPIHPCEADLLAFPGIVGLARSERPHIGLQIVLDHKLRPDRVKPSGRA